MDYWSDLEDDAYMYMLDESDRLYKEESEEWIKRLFQEEADEKKKKELEWKMIEDNNQNEAENEWLEEIMIDNLHMQLTNDIFKYDEMVQLRKRHTKNLRKGRNEYLKSIASKKTQRFRKNEANLKLCEDGRKEKIFNQDMKNLKRERDFERKEKYEYASFKVLNEIEIDGEHYYNWWDQEQEYNRWLRYEYYESDDDNYDYIYRHGCCCR